MQVAHRDDHITHAVISKAKPIELQMAQSAEFFQVLFKSLYKYPTVAMVRETICNAWDAHIEAGKLDTPIEITLTTDEFIIRDQGFGIPEEDMAIRYCVMGGSTKAKDVTVTGGFGLGCKAPFAVTDHFEVTSMSQGRKTIYNLSRSAGAVEGVPACIPIVTVPTTETGLQVKVPLNVAVRDLEATIRRVIYGGGIYAKLNGEILERLPLSLDPGSWVISRKQVLAFGTATNNIDIHIRYGNVVYPGRDLESYMPTEYRQVHQFLERLHKFLGDTHSNRVMLVIQAQPGTLSVTPSRETLSMVPKTVDEIKKLFAVVHTKLLQDTIPVAFEAVKDTVEAAVGARDVRALTCVHHVPPHASAHTTSRDGYYYSSSSNRVQVSQSVGMHLTSVSELGRALIHNKGYYESQKGLRKADLQHRINMMLQDKLLDPGVLQSFRKLLSRPQLPVSELYRWFRRRIVVRLMNAMMKHPHLDHNKLYIPKELPYGEKGELVLAKAWASHTGHALHYMAFLRKIVLLAHSKEILCYNLNNLPDKEKVGGYSEKCLAYIVPRDEKCVEAAKILFERHGYVVIDMTKTQDWMELPPRYEREINKPPKVRKITKPKAGFVPLKALLAEDQGDKILRAIKSSGEVRDRVVKPKGVLQLERENYGDRRFRLRLFGHKASIKAARLYGHEIGVVTNSESLKVSQEKKKFAVGERYILDQVIHEMTTNPNIIGYLPYYCENLYEFRILSPNDGDDLVRLCLKHPQAKKHLGFKFKMTPHDWEVLGLWHALTLERNFDYADYYPETKVCPLKALEKNIKNIPLAQTLKDLLEWVNLNTSWCMLDVTRIRNVLKHEPTTDKRKAEHKLAGQLLMSVLKGK